MSAVATFLPMEKEINKKRTTIIGMNILSIIVFTL
jgi:hypothetical protein